MKKLLKKLFKKRVSYTIIGTGTGFGPCEDLILVDLISSKTQKHIGVYVWEEYYGKVIKLAAKGKPFKLPKYAFLTKPEYEEIIASL